MNTNLKFRRAMLLTWLVCLPVAALMTIPSARADESCGSGDSWIFLRSRFSHDPESGVRVAQYAMKPAIEPLPDVRLVTSGYSRSRSVLRGPDGSASTYYQVQSYGNGRGGLDAEWERFHDAWRGSTIAGGSYRTGPYVTPYYGGYGGYGPYGGYAYGHGYGHGPGYGYGSGYGHNPGYGYGSPDYGRLDPDAADGYPDPDRHRRFHGHPLLYGP